MVFLNKVLSTTGLKFITSVYLKVKVVFKKGDLLMSLQNPNTWF